MSRKRQVKDEPLSTSGSPAKDGKIAVATPPFSASLNVPFAQPAEGRTALKCRVRVGAAGHNNIKHQSRVPRDASENPEFQPKEEL
jgi:hypothetical protein